MDWTYQQHERNLITLCLWHIQQQQFSIPSSLYRRYFLLLLSDKTFLSSENRVGTACAKCRLKREVIQQMSGDILDAWAATEINDHKRKDDFAVLITIQPAYLTKWLDDHRWKHGVKLLHDWKNSSKRCEFLRFYCYLCHVCRVWYIFWFATLR